MLQANKKIVRMTTSGMRKFKNRQQRVKEHEVLTKSAFKRGSKKR